MKNEIEPNTLVLVRNSDEEEWNLRTLDRKTIKGFLCQDNLVWTQCIPYDMNEYLHGTTDRPTLVFNEGEFIAAFDGKYKILGILNQQESPWTALYYFAFGEDGYTVINDVMDCDKPRRATAEEVKIILDKLSENGLKWDSNACQLSDLL